MGVQPVHSSGDDDVMRDLRRQARTTPPLENDEEKSLLEKSSRGDRGSRDRLVAAHLGMVIMQAEARQDKGLSIADLVMEGSLGFVDAVRSFDAGAGGDFAKFAERKVGEQMDAAIESEAAAVRDAQLLVEAASDYERTELILARELRRAPKESEIAEKLEWTIERTRYVAQVVAEARRQHDEELLQFIDPDAIDIDETVDGE